MLRNVLLLSLLIICTLQLRLRTPPKKPQNTDAVRPGLSQDEVDEIRQAFDLFDTNNSGKISPKELAAACESLGFITKNPNIFKFIAELDTPEAAKKGGVDFDFVIEQINNKLGDMESREGVHRIFMLFLDDPESETITLDSFKKIARELGETMTDQELKNMFMKASNNSKEINFDQFFEFMTTKN